MPNAPREGENPAANVPDIELLRARGYLQLKDLITRVRDGVPEHFYIHPVDDSTGCRSYFLYDESGNQLPLEPVDYAELALVPENLADLQLRGPLHLRKPRTEIPGPFYIYPVDHSKDCRSYILYDLAGNRVPLNPIDLSELAQAPEDELSLKARGVYKLQTPRAGIPGGFYIYPVENSPRPAYLLYNMDGTRIHIEPVAAEELLSYPETWTYLTA